MAFVIEGDRGGLSVGPTTFLSFVFGSIYSSTHESPSCEQVSIQLDSC